VGRSVEELIAEHRAAGRDFEAGGVRSFVREQGEGDPVVLVHGVPTCSYLWRKVLPGLADSGMRGVAFDLPGLGFAQRPQEFDYSWGGLARWTGEAVDALGIERCHLVVHDIGGPIGCEWAVRNPDRVLSLTALNIMLEVADFRRPWFMHLFVPRGVGEAWLRSMNRFALVQLFSREGLGDRSAVPKEELGAYYDLLKRGGGDGDGGRMFLRIMRGFELTEEKQRLFAEGLGKRTYPAQIVWGRDDGALNPARAGVERILGTKAELIAGKHFIQEDQATAVVAAVVKLAAQPGG
jgi:haloalkane dehalogenase